MRKLLLLLLFFSFFSVCEAKAPRGHEKRLSDLSIALEKKITENHPPSWMLEQITEDLSPFLERGINIALIEKAFEKAKLFPGEQIVKCDIKNNEPVFFCESKEMYEFSSFKQIKSSIELICKMRALPDLCFLMTLHDQGVPHPLGIPLFAFAKDSTSKGVILIPDFEALDLTACKNHLKEVKEGMTTYPWGKKKPIAYFRGNTTGGIYTKDNFLSFPRSKAVFYSLKYPHLINARFVHLCQTSEPQAIKNAYPEYFSKNKSISDHLLYKYQLLIDGNTCAYSRAYWQLFSNCVILKQNSHNIQWYYRNLKPYEHFIPVEEDLSDVVERVEWAKRHDLKVRKISENAQRFAKEHLNPSSIYYYFYLLLSAYGTLNESY